MSVRDARQPSVKERGLDVVERADLRLAELRREVAALAGRYRSAPESRLRRPLPPFASTAEAGRQLAQRLADWSHAVETEAEPGPESADGTADRAQTTSPTTPPPTAPAPPPTAPAPPPTAPAPTPSRRLPDHGPLAVGDQLAVTGFDLAAAAAEVPGAATIRSGDGRRLLADLLEDAVHACRDLRAQL